MKYKNIISAIHNFGHSFLSSVNYVDNDFVIDELRKINRKNYDIEVNWKTNEFLPKEMLSNRISKSIGFWSIKIIEHFESHNVEFERIKMFKLKWNNGEKPKVIAIDDRDMKYEIEITKTL